MAAYQGQCGFVVRCLVGWGVAAVVDDDVHERTNAVRLLRASPERVNSRLAHELTIIERHKCRLVSNDGSPLAETIQPIDRASAQKPTNGSQQDAREQDREPAHRRQSAPVPKFRSSSFRWTCAEA